MSRDGGACAMLKGLQLEDYRAFRRHRLDGLARVDLLVGVVEQDLEVR